TLGRDAAGGDQAFPVVGSGESGPRRLARAREAALSQSSADSRDRRALDWQIRTPSPPGVERFEEWSRRKQKQERITTCKHQSRFTRHSFAPRRKSCGRPSPSPNSRANIGPASKTSPTGRKARNGSTSAGTSSARSGSPERFWKARHPNASC